MGRSDGRRIAVTLAAIAATVTLVRTPCPGWPAAPTSLGLSSVSGQGLWPFFAIATLIGLVGVAFPSVADWGNGAPARFEGRARFVIWAGLAGVGLSSYGDLLFAQRVLEAGADAGTPWIVISTQLAGSSLLWLLARWVDTRGLGGGLVVVQLTISVHSALRLLPDEPAAWLASAVALVTMTATTFVATQPAASPPRAPALPALGAGVMPAFIVIWFADKLALAASEAPSSLDAWLGEYLQKLPGMAVSSTISVAVFAAGTVVATLLASLLTSIGTFRVAPLARLWAQATRSGVGEARRALGLQRWMGVGLAAGLSLPIIWLNRGSALLGATWALAFSGAMAGGWVRQVWQVERVGVDERVIWLETRAAMVPIILARLHRAGIDARASGCVLLSLLPWFGSLLPARIVVASANERRALRRIDGMFERVWQVEEGVLSERTDTAAPLRPLRRPFFAAAAAVAAAAVLLVLPAGRQAARPSNRATGDADLWVARVRDDLDPLRAFLVDLRAPPHIDFAIENAPVDGGTAPRAYALVRRQEGESWSQARARLEAFLTSTDIPEGARFVVGRFEESSGDSGYRSYLLEKGKQPLRVVAAQAAADEETLAPFVAIELDRDSGAGFGALTQSQVGRRVAVVIDHELITAPRVLSPIWGGRVTLSLGDGGTREDAERLARRLRGDPTPFWEP